MKIKSILVCIILFIILLFAQAPAVAGEWTSSHTMTLEPGTVIYNFDLEYQVNDWWFFDLAFERDVVKGSQYDLSTTLYLPIEKHIYSTAGIRLSHQKKPDRKWTPYLSVTYRY